MKKGLKRYSKKERIQSLTQKIEALKTQKKARQKRLRVRFLILGLLLLLLIVCKCSCEKFNSNSPQISPSFQTPTPKPSYVEQKTNRVRELNKLPRPVFTAPPVKEPKWTQILRTQVSARSAKLSSCFPNAPMGMLRWNAHISGASGLTTQHEFQELNGMSEITNDQKLCLIKIFAEIPYSVGEFNTLETQFSFILAF